MLNLNNRFNLERPGETIDEEAIPKPWLTIACADVIPLLRRRAFCVLDSFAVRLVLLARGLSSCHYSFWVREAFLC